MELSGLFEAIWVPFQKPLTFWVPVSTVGSEEVPFAMRSPLLGDFQRCHGRELNRHAWLNRELCLSIYVALNEVAIGCGEGRIGRVVSAARFLLSSAVVATTREKFPAIIFPLWSDICCQP
jgi:hypothetical protein